MTQNAAPGNATPMEFSGTLPELPRWAVLRDDLVNGIRGMFETDARAIALVWPTGSGKTTLLAQFVAANPADCISFFFAADYWRSSPSYFLSDLCSQLAAMLGERFTPGDVPAERLPSLFESLVQRLPAVRRGRPTFWVFDGIDEVSQSLGATSVLDYVPTSPGRQQFLVVSAATDPSLTLPRGRGFETRDYTPFGRIHTAAALSSFALADDVVTQIHLATDGFPAYVSEVYRLLDGGEDPDDLLKRLPKTVRGLLDEEWRGLAMSPEDKLALAILTASTVSISTRSWASMSGLDQDHLEQLAATVPFLQRDRRDLLQFPSTLHRDFVAEKTSNRRTEAQIALVDHWRANPDTDEAMALLPGLLREAQTFGTLKSLIDASYLTRSLAQHRDVMRTAETIASAGEGASRSSDVASSVFFAMCSGAVRSSMGRFADLGEEVSALCQVGLHERALSVATAALLPQDQLRAVGALARGYRDAKLEAPPNLDEAMERLATQVPTTLPTDVVAQLAASFFDVRPELAIALIERCVSGEGERALDKALLLLALHASVEEHPSSGDVVSSRITDERVRNVARSLRFGNASMSAEDVLREADKITDVPARLFLLQQWCAVHRADGDVRVVDLALDLIETEPTYTSSLRQLRQICEAIAGCSIEDAARLVGRIEGLRPSLPDRPMQESLRLDAICIAQAARHAPHRATQLLAALLERLEGETSTETRAYGLARALRLVRDPAPGWNTSAYVMGVTERLREAFDKLLDSGADHEALAFRTIANVAYVDVGLASEMASLLNYPDRRDRAFREVVSACIVASKPPSADQILHVVTQIQDRLLVRGIALQTLISSVADGTIAADEPCLWRLRDQVQELADPADRAACLARLGQAMAPLKAEQAVRFAERAVDEWSQVEDPFRQRRVGLELVGALKLVSLDLAREFIDKMLAHADALPWDPYFGRIYTQTVAAVIAAYPSDARSGGDPAEVRRLVNVVPSHAMQADLLGQLASRHMLAGDRKGGLDLLDEAEQSLLVSTDAYLKVTSAEITLAYPRFQRDNDGFYEHVATMPDAQRNEAISDCIVTILTRSAPGVPVDSVGPSVQVDISQCNQTTDLIALLTRDVDIESSIKLLVNIVLDAGPSPQLPPKTLVRISDRLSAIIAEKLPDPVAIQHHGWRILADGHVLRLRHAAQSRKAPEAIATDWRSLVDESRGIPNVADRAFVLAGLALESSHESKLVAREALEASQESVGQIAAIADRVTRLDLLADAYVAVDDVASATDAIRRAWADALELGDDPGAARAMDALIETAHAISPELASSLTPLVDDQVRRYSVEQANRVHELQRRPTDPELLQKAAGDPGVFARSAWMMRRSIASGRARALADRDVITRLRGAAGGSIGDVLNVVCWAAENARIATWSATKRQALFDAVIAGAEFVSNLGEAVAVQDRETGRFGNGEVVQLSSLSVFGLGRRDEAMEEIRAWVDASARGYLLIIDPYFSPADLSILKGVPDGVPVRIVANVENQKVGSEAIAPHDLERQYAAAWRRVADFDPPNTLIQFVGTRSKGSPLHGRHLFTEGAGITVDASLGGLGSKVTTLRRLDAAEAHTVEREQLEPLSSPVPSYRGEPLKVVSFALCD